jgi:hypothetical protein
MAGRLLSWPIGLGFTAMERISGPRARGEAQETVGGAPQTSASPYGLVEWQLDLPPIRADMARAYRGLITALHGGANAVRVQLPDPDRETPQQAGMTGLGPVPWGNGLAWSNGLPWNGSYSTTVVAAASAIDTSIVYLDPATAWGGLLDMGSRFGFVGHFGAYDVTEVIAPGAYRVWPRLRKATAIGDIATFTPIIAARLKSRDAANLPRGVALMEGLSIQLVEVPDYTVREWFTL